MIKLIVDNKEIVVDKGTVLLEACLRNDVYIPNLCHLEGTAHPDASCRLCFVEIDGKVVPSCTVEVTSGMTVKTDTPKVRKLQQNALRLLLSVHDVDCKNCPANKKCALQDIAKFLRVGLKPKGLDRFLKEPAIVRDHPFIDFYPNRCVLCGRCVRLCKTKEGRPLMNFSARGFDTVISFYGANSATIPACDDCQTCAKTCPVGALVLKARPTSG